MGVIVLVRHGEAAGATGRAVGWTDLPLSDAGRAQAADLAAALVRIPWAGIFTSPLKRARDTLAPLATACGLAPTILSGLAEISLGQWDGQAWDEIRRHSPEAFVARGRDLAGYRPPGGESFADLAERADAALDLLAAGSLPVLAMTHAGVIRVLLARVQGLPLASIFRFSPGEGLCTVLEAVPGGLSLAGFNLAPGEAAGVLL